MERARSVHSRGASSDPEPAWQGTLQRIYWVQSELAELVPGRDDGLVPAPPADARGLARAERRVGRRLPPSYRAFLARFDGWPRFFDGATLLGTRDLGKRRYADLAEAAREASETPVPAGGPPSSRVHGHAGEMIPFGIDPAGTTLFAFDPTVADDRGEMGVVAWIGEIGIRRASFHDFLEGVLEMCEADRSSALAMHASSTPPPWSGVCERDPARAPLAI